MRAQRRYPCLNRAAWRLCVRVVRAGMRDTARCVFKIHRCVCLCVHMCHCLQSTVYGSLAEIWCVCIRLVFASQCQRLYFVLLPFTALCVCVSAYVCVCVGSTIPRWPELCYGPYEVKLKKCKNKPNTCFGLLNSFMCGKLNKISRAAAAGQENHFFHPPSIAAGFPKSLQDTFITFKCFFWHFGKDVYSVLQSVRWKHQHPSHICPLCSWSQQLVSLA